MALRIGTLAAVVATAALAACGGGGENTDSTGGPTPGLPDLDQVAGVSQDVIDTLNDQLDILNSDVVVAGRTPLPDASLFPPGGTASYAGFGTIFDTSLTTADTTVAALRNRAVVTDVVASVDFSARSLNVTQSNFRDIEGNFVAGSVGWTGTFDAQGFAPATVTGDVGGTNIDTGQDQAIAAFYGDETESAISGFFDNAVSSGSGWLQGSSAEGSFAATRQ